MDRDQVWLRLMSAALARGGDDDLHLAQRAARAAIVADYALGEYEQRIVGRDESWLHFEPVHSLPPSASPRTSQE